MLRRLLQAAGVGVGAAAAGFGWGLLEARLFTVRRVELRILPPGGNPLKVLHVSDVHLLTRQRRKLRFVRTLASLQPDLVINTGDNIAEAGAVGTLMSAWATLRSVPGAFVFGSNDYYAPHFRNPLKYLTHGRSKATKMPRPDLPVDELRAGLSSGGWIDLTHRRATLSANGNRISLRGVDDAHLGLDDYGSVAGPADDSADLNIAVTHAPYQRVLDAMTADGMDLIFAGHTHGGQVCVPGYGALITNCDLNRERVKGLSTHTHGARTSRLHVSGGVGTSPYAPYRFACRPEVTLLTLLPRAV